MHPTLRRFMLWLTWQLVHWNYELLVAGGCNTDERWRMQLGWWLEPRIETFWFYFYEGSDQEIEDALDGRPLHHMTERQQAHAIATYSAEGQS
jgi:hypothetical protein